MNPKMKTKLKPKTVAPAANRRHTERASPISRPPLPRSHPIRNFAGILGAHPDPGRAARPTAPRAAGAERDSKPKGRGATKPAGKAGRDPAEVKRDPGAAVARGVNAGYRVIEEYLRQGQDFARSLWPGSPSSAGGSPDAPMNMTERLIRSASDLAGLFSEFLQTFSLPGTLPAPGSMPIPGFGIEPKAAAPADAENAGANFARDAWEPPPVISIDLRSSRRTEVTVNLRSGAWADRLQVHDLRPLKPARADGARLTGVSATGVPAERRVVLAAAIAADLPADTYSGLIVDADTNLPRGTVAIRIFAAEAVPRAKDGRRPRPRG